MLERLFESLAAMTAPDDVRISFVVVENNGFKTLDLPLRKIAASAGDVAYLLEPRIGISHARNRALRYAMERGFDLLAFVDDDEWVRADWLARLLAAQRRGGLDLVGSPVRPVPLDGRLSPLQAVVWSGMRRNQMRAERKCLKKVQRGEAGSIKIATGSWLGRLDFFRETELAFDPRFGLSGGEDWALWAEAKAKGARTGWAPDAIVHEMVPACRLTLAYQFRRSRDHAITQFRALHRADPQRALRRFPSKLLSRSFKLVVALASIPLRGGQAIVNAARETGALVGLAQARLGKPPPLHYATTTGR